MIIAQELMNHLHEAVPFFCLVEKSNIDHAFGDMSFYKLTPFTFVTLR